MGSSDAVSLVAKMENRGASASGVAEGVEHGWTGRRVLIVLLFAAAVFFATIICPPPLMDDVDAAQAQIARNMLDCGDWVTVRLDEIPYWEKPPLIYWMMAASYCVLGVHDWAGRIPIALSAVLLLLDHGEFCRMGHGTARGSVGWSLARHLRRSVLVHSHFDTRCNPHPYGDPSLA